jgi:hypothetical protein
MSAFRAAVLRDLYDFQRNTVRLVVIEQFADGRAGVLASDGTRTEVDEGQQLDDAGIVLPAGAIEAIAVALQDFQGHTSHANTEARVLREWLKVERERTDRALEPPR